MHLVVVTTDGLTMRNTARLAAGLDLDVHQAGSLDELDQNDSPAAVVIDLEVVEATAVIGDSKARWPTAMVIGVVTMPGGDAWNRAEAAGCDLVTTRGALAKSAPARLSRWIEAPGGRRIRLFSLADVAGRLGVLDRIEDPTVGPLAVYRVGGEIRVARDTCPHAGARLSLGEVDVDEGVVTCPEHGSRFDLDTGRRVRGPADEGLDTFRVVIEEGQAYVQLEQE